MMIRPSPNSKIKFYCDWIASGWSVETEPKQDYRKYFDSGWLGSTTCSEDGLKLCWRYLGAL